MTRINIIPVSELSNQHLFAEWREMPRLVGNLQKSLNRKNLPFKDSEIPSLYTLGKGHVKFFYDKFKYLHDRHKEITKELIKRNYKLSISDSDCFKNVPSKYYNDYTPTNFEMDLNRARITENIKKSLEKKNR